MKPGLGQRLIDARLIGAERAAPLQQQRDAIEGEPRAQVPALARCARFGASGLSASVASGATRSRSAIVGILSEIMLLAMVDETLLHRALRQVWCAIGPRRR